MTMIFSLLHDTRIGLRYVLLSIVDTILVYLKPKLGPSRQNMLYCCLNEVITKVLTCTRIVHIHDIESCAICQVLFLVNRHLSLSSTIQFN